MGGMRCVLWPMTKLSVNAKCDNHGIQTKKSNTVFPAMYEASLCCAIMYHFLSEKLLLL
jgi:hypothetical protein